MNAYIISALMFYASFTGRPAYTLIADNWQQRHDLGSAWRQHQLQYGDLNTDGITDQNDAEIYSALMSPFGWAIATTSKVHWYRDCQYIKSKAVIPCLIDNRLCLTCAARKLRTKNSELP
jgi:hypothetical protein